MIVIVRFFTRLREITGRSEEAVELGNGATVKMALEALSARYGEEYARYVFANEPAGFQLQFLINGRSIAQMEGLETKLRDGDTLAIVPPVGGGQASSGRLSQNKSGNLVSCKSLTKSTERRGIFEPKLKGYGGGGRSLACLRANGKPGMVGSGKEEALTRAAIATFPQPLCLSFL